MGALFIGLVMTSIVMGSALTAGLKNGAEWKEYCKTHPNHSYCYNLRKQEEQRLRR